MGTAFLFAAFLCLDSGGPALRVVSHSGCAAGKTPLRQIVLRLSELNGRRRFSFSLFLKIIFIRSDIDIEFVQLFTQKFMVAFWSRLDIAPDNMFVFHF